MIIVSGFFIGILIAYGVYGWLKSSYLVEGIDRKENTLYILYPVAHEIIKVFNKLQFLKQESGMKHSIERLEVGGNTEKAYEYYCYRKVSLVYLIFIISCIIIIFADIGKDVNELIHGHGIRRPEQWEEETTMSIGVALEGMSGQGENEYYQRIIDLEVSPKEYKEEEIVPTLEKGLEYLLKVLRGENDSYEEIKSNLSFIQHIPYTPIKVKYQSENSNLVGSQGEIYNEDISKDGETTAVLITLSLQGKKLTHRQVLQIEPKEYTKEEALDRLLEEAAKNANEENKESEVMYLPEYVDGYRINWNEIKEDSTFTIFLISLITMVLVWTYSDQEVEKNMKKRKRQMLIEYPEIIHKLTLLLNSGMTIRQSWCKIVEDYMEQRTNQNHQRSYALEEMKITYHELEVGIPEEVAYNQFGKRVGILPYLKLSTLIIQNFKKGNKGLIDTLIYEAAEAMEERKAIAKRLGEEAGTKLLMPMMTMLVLIFVIVMVPAFMSMSL